MQRAVPEKKKVKEIVSTDVKGIVSTEVKKMNSVHGLEWNEQ